MLDSPECLDFVREPHVPLLRQRPLARHLLEGSAFKRDGMPDELHLALASTAEVLAYEEPVVEPLRADPQILQGRRCERRASVGVPLEGTEGLADVRKDRRDRRVLPLTEIRHLEEIVTNEGVRVGRHVKTDSKTNQDVAHGEHVLSEVLALGSMALWRPLAPLPHASPRTCACSSSGCAAPLRASGQAGS